ncbi:MAG: ATP-binding protein [Gemmatimonadota bacterium]|nr:ATP-binding protein [Gemmatimonadota bacterium]MDH5760759.1 ATP-binding protein [Gemmatimonadota bacterium]
MHLHPSPPDIISRLREHRTIGTAPQAELEWLAANGLLRKFEEGQFLGKKGQHLDELDVGVEIMLSGRIANYRDRGAGARKVIEWQAGDVSGVLPFSRMVTMVGDTFAEATGEAFTIPMDKFPEMIRECPSVTATFVHIMLDRARVFNTSEWQDEKLVSLGRLSAGLAHEMNNPASAVARSATILPRAMADADKAARALASAGPTAEQLEAIDRIREACMNKPAQVSLSPLERADREDEIAHWLETHGADLSALDALASTAVTVEALDELARHLEGPTLDAALDWVAAGCAVRGLASESERAASRITDLVSAMKRLTHMDLAPTRAPVDLEGGLRDTMLVLGHKARDKSVSFKVEVAPDLPTVHALGGELNQVWMNLLDNALDAVDVGGSISVTVKPEGPWMVVRVVDDGVGISEEHQRRIFDPFFTTKGPGKGTGLGLEIARNRVRGHGGNIEFDSRPGRTEFRVMLPLQSEGSVTPAQEVSR